MQPPPPIGEAQGKKGKVEAMFDRIAPRYDLLNLILSFGIDRLWRRKAVRLLRTDHPKEILDVATGTGDLAIAALALDPERVVGVDISEGMLALGRKKIEARGLSGRITLATGDSENLPFGDASFDAVLVAFGVRNFENLGRGLEEMRRVLRPDGALVVLEFSRPTAFPIKQLYRFYSEHVMPRIGGALSKDRAAYEYLPESAAVFPAGEEFLERMRRAGYRDASAKPLTFGIASLYKGYK